jgi:lysyl-tRNA synthetase class 2
MNLNRKEKYDQIIKEGFDFPNHFQISILIEDLKKDEIDIEKVHHIAGRIVRKRIMGKASFFNIQQQGYQIQIYFNNKLLSEEQYQYILHYCDIGDICGVVGSLFYTSSGEVTLKATQILLLNKSLHDIPSNFYGVKNKEVKYRQRYLDLIGNNNSYHRFVKRSLIINFIRNYLNQLQFIEVETPILQPIAGGADAEPFITYHNSLNRDLFLRISPELYLKQLIVGGFEKIYELNRSFRNEGISRKHNPEFTMLEFYECYSTYIESMERVEDLFNKLNDEIGSQLVLPSKFERCSFLNSISQSLNLSKEVDLTSEETLLNIAQIHHIPVKEEINVFDILVDIFNHIVEPKLSGPIFITHHPIVISPLAKANQNNPIFADRWELYIDHMEIANSYSELNDSQIQKKILQNQSDQYDRSFIKALEYGMPPTVGVGIGIDRLVMLMTGAQSIKEVLFFPHLKDVLKKDIEISNYDIEDDRLEYYDEGDQ